MEIYTTSQARSNLFKIVAHAVDAHDPVYIVGKKHKAVLVSEEDYRAMLETVYLLSIPGLKESIIHASKEPLESFSETLDWDDE